MDLSLYKINYRLLELLDDAHSYETKGEPIPEELNNELIEYMELVPAKVDNIAGYFKYLDDVKESADKEIERVKAIKDKADSYKQWLEERIIDSIVLTGKKEIKSKLNRFLVTERESVKITDEFLLPEQCLIKKVTTKPDKKLIKELIKLGTPLQGAELVKNKHLKYK